MNLTTEVLVCTYNGTAFVFEQLQSILKQSTKVNKISIYDDQSSDDTVIRIKEFVAQLPLHEQRLFAIHVNDVNLGYARNFASAIEKSTKDILLLCDQDDVWEFRKVEILLALFRDQEPDMVFSDGSLIDHTGRQLDRTTVLQSYGLTDHLGPRFRESAFELLMKRNYINGAAAAIRRVPAQNALPLPCDMPHDYWLAIWCSLHNGVVATPEVLYRYRQHAGNAIGMSTGSALYEWLGIWRQPAGPRERELRIWKAITHRIAFLPQPSAISAAQRKLDWLSLVVGNDKKKCPRAFEIFKSILNGSYQNYSPKNAVLRDIVSLIK